MGIRFSCPNGHKLNVKEFLAGKRGVCPQCGAKFVIPAAGEPEPGMMTSFAGARESAAGLSSAELGSQSVIIAVTDSASPRQAIEPPPITLQPISPAAVDPIRPVAPPIVTNATTQSRPATGYELRRERNRRNQITLAIVLLVAVILLAIVLIVVLQDGAEPSTAPVAEGAKVSSLERLSQLVRASTPS